MDWQDELRRLDKQLSEGEISAQEYRRMRDELLAEASAPAQGRGSLWSTAQPEVTPEHAAPPSAAPVRPAPAPPPPAPPKPPPAAPPVTPPPVPASPVAVPLPAQPSPDAEDTQIVADTTVVVEEDVAKGKPPKAPRSPVDQTDVHAEPTIAPASHAMTPAPAPAPATAPADDPDRTATVAAGTVENADGATQAPAGEWTEMAPEAPAGSRAKEPKAKPPSFPPRPADRPIPKAPPLPAPAPWTGQVLGEEVFANAKPQGGGRRAATVLLSVVVALAVVGGAVWYIAFRNDDPPEGQAAQNPPATQETKPPSSKPAPSSEVPPPPANLGDAVAPLPGVADKNSGTITAARAGKLKLIAPQEVKAANNNGVTDVIFRGSTNGTYGNALLVFTTPDSGAAGKLATAETKYLRDAGFTDGKQLRDGIPVLEWTGGGATVYRVVYTTGKYTVRFGVAQRDANPAALRKELETVADTILAVLPG